VALAVGETRNRLSERKRAVRGRRKQARYRALKFGKGERGGRCGGEERENE